MKTIVKIINFLDSTKFIAAVLMVLLITLIDGGIRSYSMMGFGGLKYFWLFAFSWLCLAWSLVTRKTNH